MDKSKIIIVEDERIVAEDLREILQNLGYEVVALVASAQEAIAKTEKLQPSLVLMDIMLKGNMDGIKAAEAIRSSFGIPVVYLTAYSDDNTLQCAKVTEPFGYVLKPFQERELQITIEMVLYKHRMDTKRKQEEEYNKRMERLAALGQFAASIAHEIRNPLSSISLAYQYLDKHQAVNPQHQSIFTTIYQSIEKIQKIIQGILDFTRPMQPSFQEVDIHAVLDTGLHAVADGLKKHGITVIKHYQAGSDKLRLDTEQLAQVFINLFTNACQAMAAGGTLTLTTAAQETWIEVTVADTGNGISSQDIPKLFQPFFTTKPHGVGLGLAIVAKIIEQHHAQISVKSSVGTGTQFIVRFPKVTPTIAESGRT